MTSSITGKPEVTLQPSTFQSKTDETLIQSEKKGLTVRGQVVSVIDGRDIINTDLQIVDSWNTTIATVRTNMKGEFKFNYSGTPTYKFKVNVLAPAHGVYAYESKRKVFDTFKITISNTYTSDQRHIEIFKDPFQVDVMEAAHTKSQDNKIAFVNTPARYIFKKEHVPDLVDFDFFFTLGKGALPSISKALWVKAKEVFTDVSTEEIQQIFSPSKDSPKHTVETLADLLINFNDPHVFIKKSSESKEDDKEFTYEIDLREFKKESDFKGVGLPEYLSIDLSIKKKDGKEYLDISQITIDHPKFGKTPVTRTSGSKEFEEFIAYACDTLFTLGEIDTHLTRTHLIAGYLKFITIRNFLLKTDSKGQESPLLELFTEFVKGIMRINFLGKTEIFSAKDGVFKDTNLPQESLDQLINNCFKQGSYNFKPRKPLGTFDRLGQIKEILFDIASQAREFLKDKRKIIESSPEFLHEIWTASEDMRRHGLKNIQVSEKERSSWVDGSERPASDSSYVFEPIMMKEGVFGDAEWEKLNALSVYLIYTVLAHHIIHTAQEIYAAFPKIYSLSGRSEKGVSSEGAMDQLIFKNVLVNFEKEIEPLLTDEKVPKVFRDALKKYLDALKALLVNGAGIGVTIGF